MKEEDADEAVELISLTMNRKEGEWARETMALYFGCLRSGLDSGREYYIWRKQGRICGVVGLHRYIWGPKENVWLSWLAVRPDYQRRGIGSALMDKIQERAAEAGHTKLLVETYESKDFETARAFYRAKGFAEVGRLDDYLSDGSAMVIFGKRLSSAAIAGAAEQGATTDRRSAPSAEL